MTNILDTPVFFSAAAEVESPNWRTTWGHRAAIASRARMAIYAVVNNIPAPQWPHFHVLIMRIGANMLDDDNLVSACKPARDEIAAWLGLDDASSRITWRYSQRAERTPDGNPKRKGKYRRWLEVTVSPAPTENPARAATPPERIERERTRAPIRSDQDRSKPVLELRLPARSGGAYVCVSLLSDAHSTRVRVCTHYMQQGHAWRKEGVSIQLEEIDALVSAIAEVRARLRDTPRGVIFLGGASGGGADTPSDDVNIQNVGKSATCIPRENPPPREYSSPKSLENPSPPPKNNSQHKNPRPPPLPKTPKPQPSPPHANAAAHYLDCNATAEDSDNGQDE